MMSGQTRPNSVPHVSPTFVATATFALLVAVGIVGCAGPGGSIHASSAGEDAEALQPHARPPVADLPIPDGFALLDEQSHAFESPGVRFINHTYRGRASKVQLERFYRKHLPARGWEFRNAQMTRGTHTLRFEQDDEVLDVLIADDVGPFGSRDATVTLTVQAVGAASDEIDLLDL